MSVETLNNMHEEHQRVRMINDRLAKLEIEVAENARFRQKMLGAFWVIGGLASLVASVLVIARTVVEHL